MNKFLWSMAALATLALAGVPALAQQSSRAEQSTLHRNSHVYLGVVVQETASHEQGLQVRQVTPNSPAAKAGLKRGDLITKVGDRDVDDFDDLANTISAHKPGDKIMLQVERNGEERQLTCTLQRRPSNWARNQAEDHEEFGRKETENAEPNSERGQRQYGAAPSPFLGVQTRELTPSLKKRLNITAEEGIVVTEVVPHSPAAQAGLHKGDVITSANGKTVTEPQELRQVIQDAGPGGEVRLEVLRGSHQKDLTARLSESPVDFGTASRQRASRFSNQEDSDYGNQNQEIQRLQQRLRQLERRVRELEQQNQSQP
jgi:S1-C subfamily serine protease